MITTYIRSSSYNDWDFCQHKYYLGYVLGLPQKSNKAADKGNIVHKALELLAKRKYNEQAGISTVLDEAIGDKPIESKELTPSFVCSVAWEYCTKQFRHHKWEEKYFNECVGLVDKALDFNNGMFNPLNLNIFGVEARFDFEIIKPWSKFEFNTPSGIISGFLGLKGAIDLVLKPKEGFLEILDWKTGARKNWNTGKEKTIQCLEKDMQLRLYHYAISHMYPEIDNVFITIFYIKDGGPYSVFFNKKDIPETERMLMERYNRIRDTVKPRLIAPHFKCGMCDFSKTGPKGSSKNWCQTIKHEIIELGIDKVTRNRCDYGKLTQYGQGGGIYTV